MSEPKLPSHIAYQVRPAATEGAKPHFNRVGAAFAHKDGQGFNLTLDSVPIDGRVVLRTPKERVAEMTKPAAQKSAKAAADIGPEW